MNCAADLCKRQATNRARFSQSGLLIFCGPCGVSAMNIATVLGLQLELEPLPGVCRRCGCSDNEPCFSDGQEVYRFRELEERFTDEQLQAMPLGSCSWIEPGLCSMCVDPAPALLTDMNGAPLRGAP